MWLTVFSRLNAGAQLNAGGVCSRSRRLIKVLAFICVEPTSTDIHQKSTAMTRTVWYTAFVILINV